MGLVYALIPFGLNRVLTRSRYKRGQKKSRSHLKKVFSSDIDVEPSSQALDIHEYACGLILSLVLISTKNPNFEMASSEFESLFFLCRSSEHHANKKNPRACNKQLESSRFQRTAGIFPKIRDVRVQLSV